MLTPYSRGFLVNSILDFFKVQPGDSLPLYWGKEILVALLIFAVYWVLSRIVSYALIHWAPRLTSFTATDIDDRILGRITPPTSLLIIFAGLYNAVHSLPFHQKVHDISSGVIFVITIAILTNIVYRAMDETVLWYGDRLSERGSHGLDKQILPLVEKLSTIFIVGTALIIILKHFNYDILSLVTALGIGSLAIGMAAKDTLANMISGFTLMIDRPFRIGDRIQLTGGQIGDVQDIGLRSTKIKTAENQLLVIPNSDLCNTILTNQAFPDVRAKGRINIGVAYGSNVDQVKDILIQAAVEVEDVLPEPQPEAYFTSFGDSALMMALFFWVDDYTKVFATTDKINSLILKRLCGQGVVIPYPTRTVHIHKEEQI
ncbi:MAG: mechanosensitive ion channel family protein [Geobacteraceae bacterium]|nr:mechanosensitive ion channel family protein [Geobacteraceae bacterium]